MSAACYPGNLPGIHIQNYLEMDMKSAGVMEFMQVIKQMVRGKPVSIDPAVSFSAPIDAADLSLENIDRMQDQIVKRASNLLASHRTIINLKID